MQSVFKVFKKIAFIPTNYHCNLNSKFNHLFHSLNVTECTLRCHYISVVLYLLQTYPSEKPLFKGQGPVNLTNNKRKAFNSNCKWLLGEFFSLKIKSGLNKSN